MGGEAELSRIINMVKNCAYTVPHGGVLNTWSMQTHLRPPGICRSIMCRDIIDWRTWRTRVGRAANC